MATPLAAGHGPAKGGTMVTITGDNFGKTNSNPSVTIGGKPCQSVVWLSDTKLECVTPSGTGVGDVRVFVLDESSPENFGTVFEFDAPLVTGIVPSHGPCAGGFTVTVEGKNFGAADSHPKISLGGVHCTESQWISDTKVTCVVPKGSGESKQVLVDILGQSSQPDAKSNFAYDGPKITLLSPPNGPTIGGTAVTIEGVNFGSKEAGKDMSVRVGNVPCSSSAWESETSVSCIIPPGVGAANEVQIVLNGLSTPGCPKIEDGEEGAGLCASLYRYDAPVIAAVQPNHGPTTGGFEVSLPGDNYGTSPTSLKLSVGGEACERSTWVSNTMAKCFVPAGVGITHVVAEVEGQKSDDSKDDSDVFSYDAPKLTMINPSSGNPEGGLLVTLEGKNFGSRKDKASVLLGDTPARVVHVTNNQILFVLPPGEGQEDVSVRVAGQENVVAKGEETVVMAYSGPRVTGVSPNHGQTQGGQAVTILGRDLGLANSKIDVEVGGIDCIESTWVSETAVTCVTPPGAGGAKRVKVVIDGKLTATSPMSASFSYNAPRVVAVTPATGHSQGGSRILVQGKNFGLTDSDPVAFVGATECESTIWTDDAAVTCVTPAWTEGPVVVPVTVKVFGQRSEETSQAVYQFGSTRAATITSLAWSRAPTDGGFTITIFGSKFEKPGVKASIGTPDHVADKACRETRWVSESKVLCTAPAGVGGKLPMVIQSKHFPASSTIGSMNFDYDPPEVTAISQSTGAIGGGMRLTITGFGFGMDKNPAVGLIGDTHCTTSRWWSDSSLTCTAPPGQGKHDAVRVQVGGQMSTLRQGGPEFSHQGLAITGVKPSHAPTFGGVDITLYSRDFGDGRGGDVKASVGVSAEKSTPCTETRWVSSTAISCGVPAGVGSNLDVVVVTETAGGQKESYEGYGLFSYQRPSVTAVAPKVGNSAGGLPITLLGSSFGRADSDPGAYVGNTECTRTLYVSDTSIVCVTPAGGGSGLGVGAVIGGQRSRPLIGSFGYLAPKIIYVQPTEGQVGGGSLLTIYGRNFGRTRASRNEAFVGSSACANTTWVSDRQVVCVTPHGEDLYVRHQVSVKTEGVASATERRAQYAFIERVGGGGQPEMEQGVRGGSGAAGSRAPGVYLTIAYVVALLFIAAGIFFVRMLFANKGGNQGGGRKKSRRGVVARGVNALRGLLFRGGGDEQDDNNGSLYHIVDSIDIEMEASSEIDMTEMSR